MTNSQDYTRKEKQSRSDGDREEAVGVDDQVFLHSPNELGALQGRARAMIDQGMSHEALEILKQAIGIDPRNAKSRILRTWAFFKLDQIDAAIEDCCLGISLEPKASEPRYILAHCYHKKGEEKRAIDQFTKAIALDANDSPAAFGWRGHSKFLLGDLDGALDDYNRAVHIKPDFGQVYAGRADILSRERSFGRAIANFRKAIKYGWGSAAVHQGLADCYINIDKPVLAVCHYKKVIQEQPENYEATYWLGESFGRINKFDEAESLFHVAVIIDPSKPDAYLSLANTLYKREEYGQARKQYSLYLDRVSEKKEKSQAYLWRGNAANMDQDYKKAIEDYETVIQLDSQCSDAHLGLAACFGRQGEHEKAIACYSNAISSDPDNVSVYLTLRAVAYYETNEEEYLVDAIQDLNDVIEMKKDSSPDIFLFRAELRYMKGIATGMRDEDLEAAIDDCRHVLDLSRNDHDFMVRAEIDLGLLSLMKSGVSMGKERDRSLDQAEEHFRNSCGHDSSHEQQLSHFFMGHFLLHERNAVNKAKKYISQALESGCCCAHTYIAMGEILILEKKYQEALVQLERAETDDKPKISAKVRIKQGLCYYHMGMLNKSVEKYYDALELCQDGSFTAQANTNLGLIFYEQGLHEKAESKFSQAIEARPDCANAYHGLACLKYDMNKKGEAVKLFRMAASLGLPEAGKALREIDVREKGSDWWNWWFKESLGAYGNDTQGKIMQVKSGLSSLIRPFTGLFLLSLAIASIAAIVFEAFYNHREISVNLLAIALVPWIVLLFPQMRSLSAGSVGFEVQPPPAVTDTNLPITISEVDFEKDILPTAPEFFMDVEIKKARSGPDSKTAGAEFQNEKSPSML